MNNYLLELIRKRIDGINCAIPSYCSANHFVIEAILEQGRQYDSPVLIESTSNQVNQFGGYSGMKPEDFKNYVFEIAEKIGFEKEKIILGGDHLGPQPWQNLNEEEAMVNSKELVRQCVLAGYTKIHLDTSMRVADDSRDSKLSDETIARRGAEMLQAAEEAFEEYAKKHENAVHPVYVIGSEVPIPGGTQNDDEGLTVTSASDFRDTVEAYKKAFKEKGIYDKWKYVVAVVVQPGVEFGDEEIVEYDRLQARELTSELKQYPDLVFEGHSTDYQTPEKLKEMAEDGIAILKVGPALTHAMREGLFLLSHMEEDLIEDDKKRSGIREVLEHAMIRNPKNWVNYYHGSENDKKNARKYSFSDRCRYYMNDDEVQKSIETLLHNLENVRIPLSMLHQYMPAQYDKVRAGIIDCKPRDLIKDLIVGVVDDYNFATKHNFKG